MYLATYDIFADVMELDVEKYVKSIKENPDDTTTV